jgi:hypothetical protein
MRHLAEARAGLIDALKRRALVHLHAVPEGETLVLRTYLVAEEIAEASLLERARGFGAPEWLVAQLERHHADEVRHARAFRARLAALGVHPGPAEAGRIGRGKARRFERLVRTAAPRFEAGAIVPLLAIAWRLEVMGVRVFSRHLAVLDSSHPTARVLAAVLRDEARHVADLEHALDRLVLDRERSALAAFAEDVDAADARWAVTGAAALFAAGIALRARGRAA